MQMNAAANAAAEAQKTWREVPVQQRVRIFFKYAQLIRDNTDKLAAIITKEQGKTLADARGDVFRGLGTNCTDVSPLLCGCDDIAMVLQRSLNTRARPPL